MAKPTSKPDWIPDDDPEKIEAPSGSKQNTGWLSGEKPPFQFFNWFWNLLSKWIAYLETITDCVPVANGGTNATTAATARSNLGLAGALLGDTTDGRKLRKIRVRIRDGTNPNTIRAEVENIWNGDTIAEVDNISKGGSSGNFALSVNGDQLTINNAAGGVHTCVTIVSAWIEKDSSGLTFNGIQLTPDGSNGGIIINVWNNNFIVDFTTIASSESMYFVTAYISPN